MTKIPKKLLKNIMLSIVLVLLATVLFSLWAMGLPYSGDLWAIVTTSSVYQLIYLIVPVLVLFFGLKVLPGRLKGFRALLRPKVIAATFVLAIVLTAISPLVPFPSDHPPCCMTGPTRERGLPITYMTSSKEFGVKYTEPYPPASINVGWAIIDVALWSGLILYAYRVKNILKDGVRQ